MLRYRNMHKYLFTIISLSSLLISSQSKATTLEELIGEVVSVHPQIKEAKWDANASRQDKKMEAWLDDPMGMVEFEEVPFRKKSLGNAGMTNFSVSQEIPFLGTLITKAGAAKKEWLSKKAMVDSATREIIFETKKTYFELLAVTNKKQSAEKMLQSLAGISSSLETQYKSTLAQKPATSEMNPGNEPTMKGGTASDLLMAKMKQAEAKTQVHDLSHQLDALRAKLNLLRGKDPEASLGTLAKPKRKTLKSNAEDILEKILKQNSDLQSVEFMFQKAKKDLTVAKLSYIPTLEPSFTYNQRQDMENAYTLGVGFNIPLWVNKKSAETKKAHAEKKRAENTLASTVLNVKEEFYYLYHHAHEHSKIVGTYENEILPLAKSSMSLALQEYKTGLSSGPNVLQKIISYEQANQMYWNMWFDYQMEYALLEKLTGEDL
ncbi:MAG: hypothetical protein A2048_05720 [Deltaproteobacteria bacterium GWA2_45_12]|nr:MAG: hypothetical protein A2048_05720 [Deltaproteobacteria bacterium GWA2_45_12]